MKLRVRFAETDGMGVAHHSAHVVWLEAARVEWLRERGILYSDIEASGTNLAVSSLTIDYRGSARFDDEIHIRTELLEAKSRRFRYRYVLTPHPRRGAARSRRDGPRADRPHGPGGEINRKVAGGA